MTVEGVSHITFIVRDLDRMARFLCEGLGAVEVYDSLGKNFSESLPENDLRCNPERRPEVVDHVL
jgi:catechol 2,3-dioxygenase-like lactoylglutathione lyase family enzyme